MKFIFFQIFQSSLIEAGSDLNKKKLKIILDNTEKQLVKSEKFSGAKLLLEKLKGIEN
jgi:hypothetical protein